ncbi:MAG: hypothetical protein V3W04_06920 [Gammaproteobacteria bacterium]
MNNTQSILRGLIICLLFFVTPTQSSDDVEKVLFLVFEEDEVVASNTRFGRFDRLKMHAKEKVLQHIAAEAVAVVITNQRYIAYGIFNGWRSVRIRASEKVKAVEAEDYSALVVTSDRILNFYGRNGVWSQTRR